MKYLIIYDSSAQPGTFTRERFSGESVCVDLFPLVEDGALYARLRKLLFDAGVTSVSRCNSANKVMMQVDRLRETIGSWASDVADAETGRGTTKECLMLPGLGVSAWWFGLLAERNPLKTDVFLRIAQVNAVKEQLQKAAYDRCFIAVSDTDLATSISAAADGFQVGGDVLNVPPPRGVAPRVKLALKRMGIVGQVMNAMRVYACYVARGIYARLILGPTDKRLPTCQSVLFVSYFPYIDRQAAEKAVFLNKYALPIQNKLAEMNKDITWILFHVPFDGYTYRDSVALAKRFSANGEKMFIQEEFLHLRDAVRALYLWFRQVIISKKIYNAVCANALCAEPVDKNCASLIRQLWDMSFSGYVGMEGILYSLSFNKMFRHVSDATDCIYYAEMQAWERALNAAHKKVAPGVRTIGFQHAVAPRNEFEYFPDPRESQRTGCECDMPLPDMLAANGRLPFDLLVKSGYERITRVESVRYLYLNEMMTHVPKARDGRPVLLVAFSGNNAQEARSLLSFVHEALPRAQGYDLWCKGHPAYPLDNVFKQLGIDPASAGYKICVGAIADCLKSAWAVLVPSSAVAMEALAYGCEVIVPVSPDCILRNPVVDFSGPCDVVTSPGELVAAWDKICAMKEVYNIEQKRDFVRDYWNLDPGLPRWTALLSEHDIN